MPKIITDEIGVADHVFSFWTDAIADGWQDMPVPEAFGLWLLSHQVQLTAEMTEVWNGFQVLDEAAMWPAYITFAKENIAFDAESVNDYARRFEYDQIGASLLYDHTARKALRAGIRRVDSTNVMAVFTNWPAHPTEPASIVTYVAHQNALRAMVTDNRGMITGEALLAFAAHYGATDSYGIWLTGRLANLVTTRGDMMLGKPIEGAACWSWALSALNATTADPSVVLAWLHLAPANPDPDLPNCLGALAATNPIRVELANIKALMNQHGLAISAGTYDANWRTKPTKVAHAALLTQQTMTAIVALNGFTVLPANRASEFAVCVEYLRADGVSWQHWWVEAQDTVIETFPTQKFLMNATGVTQIDRIRADDGDEAADEYDLVRVPVQALKPAHLQHLRVAATGHLH